MDRVLALVLAAALAACAGPHRSVPDGASLGEQERAAYLAAASALESGEPAAAVDAVRPAAEHEPWHVPSHALRQDAYAALGQEAVAHAWYADEAARHPRDPARALLAARLEPRSGGAREAAYRAALKLDPSSVWARVALAYELSHTARDEAARATSLADGGFTVDAKAAAARAVSVGAEALQAAAAVAAERPDSAAAQGVYADVLLASHTRPDGTRAAEALRASEAAAALEPDSALAWGRVGRARRVLADDEGAATAFARAAGLAPRDPVHLANLGRVLLDRRKDRDARDALEDAARLAPQDVSVALNHAVALFRTGAFDAAAKEFDRASALEPSDPRPFEGLALTRAELGDREGAADAMERYLAAGGADRDAARRFIDDMRGAARP